ncbi:MAG: cytoplasmic protein [Candidatus Dadabacteria bacterium]|nr:cytoplasmic protein [Candidatus Dadabacteria bacterium]
MKNLTLLIMSVLLTTLALIFATETATAQDPVKVDPKHYKVEFENDQVRVLRISYGPHEKSVMHEHPDSIDIFLTDLYVKFTLPDGKTEEMRAKAGETRWIPGGKHLPENLSDQPLEVILVELKTMPAKAK